MPTKISSEGVAYSSLSVIPFFWIGYADGKYNSLKKFNNTIEACSFKQDSPLYFEYAEPVTMNCLKCNGSLRGNYNSDVYTLPIGTVFYLDYSLNGEDYIEIGSVATTDVDGVFTFDFNDITAQYWRLRTDYNSSYYIVNYYDIYASESEFIYLFKKDPYITFTEAPAEGDVLTMEVDMDLIMKNSDFVLDVGARIDFSW